MEVNIRNPYLPHKSRCVCLQVLHLGPGIMDQQKGCLLALDQLQGKRVQNALDMGCGSGILALAIAKRWKCRVSASDIDVVAKQTAQTNASVNGLSPVSRDLCWTRVQQSFLKNQSYDLIVSNILARPASAFIQGLVLAGTPRRDSHFGWAFGCPGGTGHCRTSATRSQSVPQDQN